jgi:hypothetical protein
LVKKGARASRTSEISVNRKGTMNKQTRNAVLLAVANLAITGLVIGCGESVPQKSAQGGVLSGTETERNRYANRRNPLLAGNAQQEVTASSSTPAALSTATPRALTTAPAPAPAPAGPAPTDATAAPPPPAAGTTGTTPPAPAPAPRASETGGTNPRGGVTNGNVPGGPERTTGGGAGGGQP